MSRVLLIRADATPRMGSGHVMRCLALAQQWVATTGPVVFAHTGLAPALSGRLEREGMSAVLLAAGEPGTERDAAETVARAQACGAAVVVADGYAFDAAWQQRVVAAGFPLLVMDDYGHASHYHADVVLNQNASARAETYARRDAHTHVLLGTRYTLLRREFLACGAGPREGRARADRVLVTLGGADEHNVTMLALEALRGLLEVDAVVVIGALNPHRAALEERVAGLVAEGRRLRLVVDADNMPELMAWAEVVITAGGSTLWEAAFLGLPSLVIITAANQEPSVAALVQAGAVVSLGGSTSVTPVRLSAELAALRLDPVRRAELGERARLLVDGQGAARVCEHLNSLCRG